MLELLQRFRDEGFEAVLGGMPHRRTSIDTTFTLFSINTVTVFTFTTIDTRTKYTGLTTRDDFDSSYWWYFGTYSATEKSKLTWWLTLTSVKLTYYTEIFGYELGTTGYDTLLVPPIELSHLSVITEAEGPL